MSHVPAAAQTKVIDALVRKECVKRKARFHPSEPSGKEVLYLITDEGVAAVGKAPSEPKTEKPKRVSKQSTIIKETSKLPDLRAGLQNVPDT